MIVSFVDLWKVSMILYTSLWHKWNLLHAHCALPIPELGHKGLKPAATLKYEPLNSYITVLSVWIIKIIKCYAYKHL